MGLEAMTSLHSSPRFRPPLPISLHLTFPALWAHTRHPLHLFVPCPVDSHAGGFWLSMAPNDAAAWLSRLGHSLFLLVESEVT